MVAITEDGIILMNIDTLVDRYDGHRVLLTLCLVGFTLLNLLYWFVVCHSRSFLIVFAVVAIVLAVFCFVWYAPCRPGKTEHLFGAALVFLGLLFTFAFTPGSVPDEPFHYWSAYSVSNLMMGKEVDFDNYSLVARQEDIDLDLNDTYILSRDSVVKTMDHAELFLSDSSEVSHDVQKSMLDYTSSPLYIRFFSALGLTLGRLANLGAYPTFMLGRLFNLLMFCGLVLLSVRITPIAKSGFMAASLLPMTLHLAASFSYDGGTIGLSFLLLALLLKGVYSDSSFSTRDIILSFILAALLAPCKAVYSVVVFVAWLIPSGRFSSKRIAYLYKIILPLICLITIVVVRIPTLTDMASAPSSTELDHRGSEAGVFYSPTDIVSDPIGTIFMFARTLVSYEDSYLTGVIGGQLGWLQANTTAPFFVVIPFIIILIGAFQSNNQEHAVELSSMHRFWFFLLAMIGWLGVMMSMYLGWTFTSEDLIQGVQGRYLLPLIVLIGLSFRTKVVKVFVSSINVFPLAMLFLNCWYLMRIVSTILCV